MPKWAKDAPWQPQFIGIPCLSLSLSADQHAPESKPLSKDRRGRQRRKSFEERNCRDISREAAVAVRQKAPIRHGSGVREEWPLAYIPGTPRLGGECFRTGRRVPVEGEGWGEAIPSAESGIAEIDPSASICFRSPLAWTWSAYGNARSISSPTYTCVCVWEPAHPPPSPLLQGYGVNAAQSMTLSDEAAGKRIR